MEVPVTNGRLVSWGTLLFALTASATSAAAATSSFIGIAGSAGDPVSNGRSYSFTPDSGAFSTFRGFDRAVYVEFSSPSHYWSLTIAAPYQGRLEVGTYSGIPLYPGQLQSQWGFRLIADGRVCSGAIANVTIQQVRYDSTGTLKSLLAVFDQTCDGASVGFSGRVGFNVDTTLYVTSTQDRYAYLSETVSFGVSAVAADGSIPAIFVTGLPPGAALTD